MHRTAMTDVHLATDGSVSQNGSYAGAGYAVRRVGQEAGYAVRRVGQGVHDPDTGGAWRFPHVRALPISSQLQPVLWSVTFNPVYTPALVELTAITLGLKLLRGCIIADSLVLSQVFIWTDCNTACEVALFPPDRENEAPWPHLVRMARLANSELRELRSLGIETRVAVPARGRNSRLIRQADGLAKASRYETLPSWMPKELPDDVALVLGRCAIIAGTLDEAQRI